MDEYREMGDRGKGQGSKVRKKDSFIWCGCGGIGSITLAVKKEEEDEKEDSS